MPQITGQTQLPGTGPLRGTWYVNIGSHNGLDVVGDGTIVRLGEQPIARDEGTGSTATLPNGVYNFTFYTEDDGAQRQHRYGPYKFELTADAVWGDVVEAPIYSPVTPTDVAQAQAARTEAVAARDAAIAAAAAAAAPADGTIAGLVTNPASSTRAAVEGLGYARTANRPVTLRDNSAIDFTGSSNSRAALQAAIDAAGVGTPIEIGRSGVIRCDTGITLQEFQRLSGPTQYHGVGGTAATEIRFPNHTGAMVGITGGGNNSLSDLLIRGPMTGADTTTGYQSTAGAPRFRRVNFVGWAYGTSISSAYYTVFDTCVWERNKYGLVNGVGAAQNYNLQLISPRFACRYGPSDSLLGYAIDGGARGLVITGGSIEGYGVAGIKLADSQSLTMTGTYFEVAVSAAGSYGIVASGINRPNLDIRGCMVYLANTARWIHVGDSTSATLNSSGNKFNCPVGASPAAPVAYYFNTTDVGNIRGRIGHDDWSETTGSTALYVPTTIASFGQMPSLEMRRPGVDYVAGDVAGNGSPEGVVFGRVGQIYRRLDGGTSTSIYVKTSGNGTNTGWTAK